MDILIPALTIGTLGLLFGIGLFYAMKVFYVTVDQNVEKVSALLAGSNCGACGFAGCMMYAEALVGGQTKEANLCKPAGHDKAQKIAELLGLQFKADHKRVAVIHCGADASQRKKTAAYYGPATCKAANLVPNGALACSFGCLGFGDCALICPFDAISMASGLPRVDLEKCTSCGKCVSVCPRRLFKLEPIINERVVVIACNSRDKGRKVRQICPVGCIACGVCEKATLGAFKVEDNLALPHYDKATIQTDWDAAVEKCPMKTIRRIV